jgi:hypothetical protein
MPTLTFTSLNVYLPYLKSVSFDSIWVGSIYERNPPWSSKDAVPAASVTDCLFHFRSVGPHREAYRIAPFYHHKVSQPHFIILRYR